MKTFTKYIKLFAFIGLFISSVAHAASDAPCTFTIVNDVGNLPVTATFTLTYIQTGSSEQQAYQDFTWPSSILPAGGTMTFTSTNANPFICIAGVGPTVTLQVQWPNPSNPQMPYAGVTYNGSPQGPSINLSQLQASGWYASQPIGPAVPANPVAPSVKVNP